MEELILRNEMVDSYLIQKLEKPYSKPFGSFGKSNPFSFGGGYVNGGLSKEAMEILSDIFSFAYMGAAEYEWGALPAAIFFLVKQRERNNLLFGEIKIKNKSIYYISPKNYEATVKERIKLLSTNKLRIKMGNNLYQFFEKEELDDYLLKTVGWIELNNGFMFFVDEEAFKKTCVIFNLMKKTNTSIEKKSENV
jgi:hypothetical protein